MDLAWLLAYRIVFSAMASLLLFFVSKIDSETREGGIGERKGRGVSATSDHARGEYDRPSGLSRFFVFGSVGFDLFQ